MFLRKTEGQGLAESPIERAAFADHVAAFLDKAAQFGMEVEVFRDKRGHKMRFERGLPIGKLKETGPASRRGTVVTFKPDPKIFQGDLHFSPSRLYRMAKSKAYLYRGVEISRAEGDLSLSLEHVRQVPIVLEAFQRGP